MTLHETIKNAIKEAMKEKNSVKLTVIRGLISAFMNEAVTKGYKPDQILTDEEATAVIKRLAKQRKDAIAQFTAGGRSDLAESEQAELAYVETYLPATMPREEIKKVAEGVIAAMSATKADMGKVIGAVVKETRGQADGADVKAVVEELLK